MPAAPVDGNIAQQLLNTSVSRSNATADFTTTRPTYTCMTLLVEQNVYLSAQKNSGQVKPPKKHSYEDIWEILW